MSDLRLVLRGAGALAAAIAIAACGGSGHAASTKTHAKTTSTAPASTGGSTTPTSVVKSGPVHAMLTGENHHPVAGKSWSYEVRVTDAGGHPLAGSVETEFVFGTTVVGRETPPVHALKNGVLKDSLTFPPDAIGHQVELQTVVHTKLGSVTLDWPVTAVK